MISGNIEHYRELRTLRTETEQKQNRNRTETEQKQNRNRTDIWNSCLNVYIQTPLVTRHNMRL